MALAEGRHFEYRSILVAPSCGEIKITSKNSKYAKLYGKRYSPTILENGKNLTV